MPMVEAPFDYAKDVDDYLPQLVLSAKKDMQDVDDDRLYIVVGPTGSGKSMLAFHMLFIYAGKELVLDFLAGTREAFAQKVKLAKDKFQHEGIKGSPLWFDEADSDNMEQNAKWNKRLFALYMKIRFLRFFHIWCWPSLKSVDRRFVEERVNGIFFCYTKDKLKARSYVFFPKNAILSMIDQDIILNYHNLKKHRDKYAMWAGKFKDYNGPYKKEYLAMKHQAGFDSVDEFYEEFGGETVEKAADSDFIMVTDMERNYGQSRDVVIYYLKKGVRQGHWVEAETKQGIRRGLHKKYLKQYESMLNVGDAPIISAATAPPLIKRANEVTSL